MEKIYAPRSKALEILSSTKGKFFTATFKKKNRTLRTLNGRLGVKKGTKGKGMSFNPTVRNLLPVWEVGNGFRMLNLATLIDATIGSKQYVFHD